MSLPDPPSASVVPSLREVPWAQFSSQMIEFTPSSPSSESSGGGGVGGGKGAGGWGEGSKTQSGLKEDGIIHFNR